MSQKRSRARAYVDEVLKSKKCYMCLEDNSEVLEFHHVNPKNKKFTISQAIHRGYTVEQIKSEMKKTVVLCSNCHKKVEYLIKRALESLETE